MLFDILSFVAFFGWLAVAIFSEDQGKKQTALLWAIIVLLLIEQMP